MNVFSTPSDLDAGTRRVCIAIGVFDGVHLGHQQVLRQTLEDARQCEGIPVAVTFDRHPAAIVAPGKEPPMIYSVARKLDTIARHGLENIWMIRFDEQFSRIPGREFVATLAGDFGRLQSLCVGSEFSFGYQRSGNVALLKEMGTELGFKVHGLSAVSLDGEPVSSTRIRAAVQSGDLDAASQMLGRAYTLGGKVMRGDQIGRQLDAPTANLDVSGLALPPSGVYAVHASMDGREHRAVLNIGVRPTLNQPEPTVQVETHLLDFNEDIYGRVLELTFVDKIRDERKFSGLDQLKQQIADDIQQARRIFA